MEQKPAVARGWNLLIRPADWYHLGFSPSSISEDCPHLVRPRSTFQHPSRDHNVVSIPLAKRSEECEIVVNYRRIEVSNALYKLICNEFNIQRMEPSPLPFPGGWVRGSFD